MRFTIFAKLNNSLTMEYTCIHIYTLCSNTPSSHCTTHTLCEVIYAYPTTYSHAYVLHSHTILTPHTPQTSCCWIPYSYTSSVSLSTLILIMIITLQQNQSYDIDFSMCVCVCVCVCVCNVCQICVMCARYVCVISDMCV